MEEPNGASEETVQPDMGDFEGGSIPPSWHSVGERLRQAREAAGLSLAEVAERTKVRPGILADIEADAHDRLPALTYALGFVKAYARTVGVDATEAGNAYRQESQKLDPVPSMVDLQPLEARRLPSRRLVFVSSFLILLLLGGFWAWGAGWLTPAIEERAPTTTAVAALPAEPVPESGAEAVVPAASRVVTLAANNEVWLQIADGGEIFFTGILQPGQSLTLPEGRQWLLRTGRAGAIDVKVGEQALPPLGKPIENLRDFPLDADTLLAWAAPKAQNGITPEAQNETAPNGIAPAADPLQEGN